METNLFIHNFWVNRNISTNKMIGHIFGIGIGTIILTTLWSICLMFCLSSARKGIQFAIIYPFIGALFTIVLLVWPREQCRNDSLASSKAVDNGIADERMIERILLADDDTPNDKQVESEIDWLAIPRLLLAIALFFLSIFAFIHQLRDLFLRPASLPPRMNK